MGAGSGNTGSRSEETLTWHRIFAASAFNEAWDLIEKTDRSSADDAALLASTFASRYHWEQVGSDENRVVGDWQIAHVASMLGYPAMALQFARAALDRAVEKGFEGWRLASCHEGMARAHACFGNDAERDRHIKTALRLLDSVDDVEERRIIESQLQSVPGYIPSTSTDE
ncbi:MAG: hypothetical protein WAM97_15690 [Acidimicrobiales bacterium]|jgi:hypothetical protein